MMKPVINSASQASVIREMQRCLRIIAQYNGDIPNVPVDGVYNRETAKAVLAFQKNTGLEPTGTVNSVTWDAIAREAARYRKQNAPALPLNVFHPVNRIAQRGDQDDITLMIQMMLRAIARRFHNIPRVTVGVGYDAATEQAVKAVQKSAGYNTTGQVDKPTWNTLVELYSMVEGIPRP